MGMNHNRIWLAYSLYSRGLEQDQNMENEIYEHFVHFFIMEFMFFFAVLMMEFTNN